MTPLPLDMTSTPAQVREARMLAQLTQEQAAYIGVDKNGPYKADTYRY